MKVAMLLKNNRKDSLKDALYTLLITIENDRIQGVNDEYLPNKEINYLSLWLMSQQVKVVYVQETDEETKDYYKKLGIEIKTYEEMQEHPLFKSFIV